VDGLLKNGQEYRIVKLVSTFVLPLPESELIRATSEIRQNSKNRAFQLKNFMSEIIGLSEMIDITDVV
jgi:hypothetical protein